MEGDLAPGFQAGRMPIVARCLLLAVLAVVVGAGCTRMSNLEGRRQRLEPPDGIVLPGIGQDLDAMHAYLAALPEGAPRPVIWSEYIDIPFAQMKLDGLADGSWGGHHGRPGFHAPEWPPMAFQIGVMLNHNDDLRRAADGELDAEILQMCAALKALDRPVFLRLGYEFNGEWNAYDPDRYRRAWVRVAKAIRQHCDDRIALVWCMAEEAKRHDYLSWYPGDAWVDWWAIDLFDPAQFTSPITEAFLGDAAARGFPVMIAETCPRRIDLAKPEAWESWFVPFFDLVERHPHIKAFCYINWDWAAMYPGSQGVGQWGDGRLERHPPVFARWLERLRGSRYAAAGSPGYLERVLGQPLRRNR